MMKYFDAFSGIGGFALAVQRTWPGAECVGFSEVDKYATAIYRKHFESHHNWGDITKIDVERISDFDLLCGGSPCQNISVANNNRAGFRGEASGLFFDWAKILKAKKPKVFLFENVDGILHSNNGWDFARLLSEVDACGYDAEWRVLNSADFGVPQRRMRCFVVGRLRGEPWRAVLSQSEEDGNNNETQKGVGSERIQSAMRTNIAGAVVTSAFDKLANFIKVVHKEEPDFSGGRIHDVSGISPTLTASEQPKIQIVNDNKFGGKVYSSDGISPCLTIGHGEGVPKIQVVNEGNYADREVHDTENGLSPTLRTGFNHVSKSDDKSCCLDTKNSQAIEVNKEQWRRLTPVECERLQAFPDQWTKEGFFKKGELVWNGEVTLTKANQLQPHMVFAKEDDTYRVVESARYHCLGNAVTVSVVQAICRKIKEVGLLD